MFDFLDSSFKRRAFKKALKEVNEEVLLSDGVAEVSVAKKHTTDRTITRIYHNMEEQTVVEPPKPSYKRNSYAKPESTAVDLRNFKNWRELDNKPKQNMQSPTPAFAQNKIDEDEEEQPVLDNPVSVRRPGFDSSRILDAISRPSQKKQGTDMDFSTYSVPKSTGAKTTIDDIVKNVNERKKAQENIAKMINEQTQIVNQPQASEQQVQETTEAVEPVKQEESKTDTSKPNVENKIKIEVVDFGDNIKPATESKKTIIRKPRGKSKKRFDADVITSVGWK